MGYTGNCRFLNRDAEFFNYRLLVVSPDSKVSKRTLDLMKLLKSEALYEESIQHVKIVLPILSYIVLLKLASD